MTIKYIIAVIFLFAINMLHAQVPVIKEPRHKPVLVNDYVRLLDVHIKPGDTTLYHIHAAPSVIVFISKSKIGSQKMGEAPVAPNEVTPAQTSFVDYGTNPITHRVFNTGNNVFHVMDIELVKKIPSQDSCNALTATNLQTQLNEKLIRTYKLSLTAGQSFIINKSSCAHLLVCIDGSVTVSNKTITTGEYRFFQPGSDIPLINNKTTSATCVLLELK